MQEKINRYVSFNSYFHEHFLINYELTRQLKYGIKLPNSEYRFTDKSGSLRKYKHSHNAGVAQLVEQGFCNSESESGDSPSEIDDKRDKKGS